MVTRRIAMFEVSEMVKRIQGSERSQRKIAVPEGAVRMDKGEPDFPTPVHIQEAATRAMKDNFTHYVDPYGDGELREAICMTLKKDYGVERSPENVLITAGGIEAISIRVMRLWSLTLDTLRTEAPSPFLGGSPSSFPLRIVFISI